MLLPTLLQAQDLQVNGKVSGTDGQGIPGVSITVQGTQRGTITKADGTYDVSAAPAATLVFSFVGYVNQIIPINNRSTINITLLEDTKALEEVVVVGYGTQKKVNLTGSVETIKGEQIARQPVVQTSQALTGLAPGLTVIQNSGQPGQDDGALRIRGLGSLGASNNVLVLVDGVEADINRIDAGDIESISVLKDASAASIYGSRASNGVIVVTTKKGASGKLTLNYRNNLAVQKPTGLPKYLGALEYLKYSGDSQAFVDDYTKNFGSDPDLYTDTDWVKELFTENGFQQYHNLSVSGGTDKVQSLASISYTGQNGNIKNYNFKRYNGLFNTQMKLNDKFDISFNLNFSKSLQSNPDEQLNQIVGQAYRIPPIYFARHSDGQWGDGWAGQNPIAIVNDNGNRDYNSNYFRGILRVNYSPIKDLKLTLMYSPEYGDDFVKSFNRTFYTVIDWKTQSRRARNNPNSLSQTNIRSFTENTNLLANYSKSFGVHDFSILGGSELIKYTTERFGASRQNFALQDFPYLDAGSEAAARNSGEATQYGLVSLFGRFNYAFKDRYLFEANVRRDASSRFAKENRVAIFPSVSAGWRLSDEPFMQDLRGLSNLKLRASWGQLGNQQLNSDFPYVANIALGQNNFVFGGTTITGATQTDLSNSRIQWETTEITNFAVDAGFLNNRLSLTAEYYVRKTKDLLLVLPVPLNLGFEPSIQNAGDLQNTGFDFSMDWREKKGDFTYGARAIFSSVKNEVTNLAGVGPIINGASITQVGSPIGLIYGYQTEGIFQSQDEINSSPAQFGKLIVGNLKYKDQLTVDTNGDGVPDQADGIINPDDRVALGNPFPTISYGLDLTASYKQFDLAVNFQGVGKRDVRLGGDMVWGLFNAGKIQEWQVKEFWSPQNTDAQYPILAATSAGSNDIQTSSTWVFNAAYLRLRNVSIGYNLPTTALNKLGMSGFRIYASGQNLLKFDKLPPGIDPLVPNGASGNIYPITALYSLGIDVKF
ncbi:SusC/RagA family TonB-linked outer membrane protein [Persicitalea sp.]|uniref:SusC/RagA family TonB-linked outer membrane protein n=1 Tax=Persicitalea sp. TaxID=3100273 RepID=UPI0035939832